jgi:Protein of unknown function (DUF3626)
MAAIREDSRWRSLLPYQRKALEHIQEFAARVSPGARDSISCILERAGLNESVYDDALKSVRTHARIGLHFHPERLSRTGTSVADGLLQGGVYKSQFETGLSSGSPSAFAGGERDLWEERLFGGAYHVTDALASSRPKYGALEIMYHPDGPAPRFGSCYFLLHPEVLQALDVHVRRQPRTTGARAHGHAGHPRSGDGSLACSARTRMRRLRCRQLDCGRFSRAIDPRPFEAISRSADSSLGSSSR